MALTAKEVAGKIGVSQATLSLVTNNKPGISDKTREKVLKELKERGYEYLLNEEAFAQQKENAPQTASGMDTQTVLPSRMLGFVTYQVGGELLGYNSFFPLIISGIESIASSEQYNITYINIAKERLQEGMRQLVSSGCIGYVIFATEMKEADLAPFEELGIPFVVLDNYFVGHNHNAVKVNNEQGTYRAVEYLVKKGHKKIGYLRSGVDINSFEERYTRAMEAMRYFGCETPEKYTFEIGYPYKTAFSGMNELLISQKELPTAFLGDNDLVLAGAMAAVQQAGYRLPEDMSFVGYDDRPICEWLTPALTSMHLPREHFGGEAVRILIRMLHGEKDLNIKAELNSELIERDSVAACESIN
ncbi:MAG: LacI family DNA-binding transcriptional regulator [Blautia sp.]|nr:LacI family DNA-binding transcriptional regulator [Blautia sp.]